MSAREATPLISKATGQRSVAFTPETNSTTYPSKPIVIPRRSSSRFGRSGRSSKNSSPSAPSSVFHTLPSWIRALTPGGDGSSIQASHSRSLLPSHRKRTMLLERGFCGHRRRGGGDVCGVSPEVVITVLLSEYIGVSQWEHIRDVR